jgi:hypothetical protein
MSDEQNYGYGVRNPLKEGIDSPEMTGVVVLGALLALFLIRRGFRGISAGGASVKIG